MLRAVCETYHSMNFSSCYYTQNKAQSLTFHLLHHCYNPNHFHLLTKIILSSATNVILKHKYYQGALLFKNFEMIPFTLTVKKKKFFPGLLWSDPSSLGSPKLLLPTFSHWVPAVFSCLLLVKLHKFVLPHSFCIRYLLCLEQPSF